LLLGSYHFDLNNWLFLLRLQIVLDILKDLLRKSLICALLWTGLLNSQEFLYFTFPTIRLMLDLQLFKFNPSWIFFYISFPLGKELKEDTTMSIFAYRLFDFRLVFSLLSLFVIIAIIIFTNFTIINYIKIMLLVRGLNLVGSRLIDKHFIWMLSSLIFGIVGF